jgi:putative ABC transport system permease protein
MTSVELPSRRLLPVVQPAARPRGMGLVEPFRVAVEGLLANKLRSFLTMLGIIIGVSAVIVMVALGEGAAHATQESIRRLGTNRLYIRPEESEVRGVRQGEGSGENLRLEDAELLRRSCRYLTAVAPEYRNSSIRVEYRNENTVTDVYGSTPEYFAVRNLTLAEGRSYNAAEMAQKARVAVLGSEVAETLFRRSPAVGKSIRINGKSFLVVGVQKPMGAAPFGNRDDQVTIPITTAMRRLFRAERIRSISVQAVSLERMKDAEEEIFRVMARAHKLKPGDPPDIRISNQADLIESASEQSVFLTMLLAGIALVSLIVGGIGIMNIMLVSVTERTREIGIRKAIGAKRRDILSQFLIESVTLCLLGGLVGIGIGIGVAFWMGRPAAEGGLGFPMLVSLPPVVASFCSAALVGIFFGTYPAVIASRLDPIEALRHE